jgi:predicted TIM-barrel fold metal-dependent hydrolase
MTSHHSWTRRDLLVSGLAATMTLGTESPARAKPHRLPAHIVDSQCHIWRPGGPKPNSTQRQEPFSYQDLLQEMGTAGVQRVIIVTPSWNPDGNAYPLEAAKTHPTRFHVMGLFDISKPPDPALIRNWKKPQGMLGIRLFLGRPDGRKWFTDGSADWLWPEAERAHVPIMIFAAGMMPELAKVAAKHPGLRLCIDSFGVPGDVHGIGAFAHYDEVLAMAKYPNIVIKAESVPYLSAEPYPYRDLHPILRKTYDIFGPERMFWESDITLLKTPYRDCARFMTELDWLSEHDLGLIMGRSVSKWVGWPL